MSNSIPFVNFQLISIYYSELYILMFVKRWCILCVYRLKCRGDEKMSVKLRQVGHSKTLTVPSNIKTAGDEYTVKNVGNTIVFTPVAKRENIFATKDWQEYDYQKDMENDLTLQPVKPVGQEVID